MTATWDERLITRHRAADIAGMWALHISGRYLRCSDCSGNITMLAASNEVGRVVNIDGMIAAVLGHMVRNHGYSLSGTGEHADV